MDTTTLELISRANGNKPRTEEEKAKMLEDMTYAYGLFLSAAGFNWRIDENSKDTPRRVAKAWLEDIVSGCVEPEPKITAFPNADKYTGIVFQGNIPVVSLCSHHNLPFTGTAYIAYLPGKNVIGLSKINRIVDWFSRRPQIQEGLTMQISNYMDKKCTENQGVAVLIEANHTCCSNRGIKHDSTMKTAIYTGAFLKDDDKARDEFLRYVADLKSK